MHGSMPCRQPYRVSFEAGAGRFRGVLFREGDGRRQEPIVAVHEVYEKIARQQRPHEDGLCV
jgi:hypothetical protein